MSDKIRIKRILGGKGGDKLKECYFEPAATTPVTYDFYDKDNDNPNNPLASGIKNGSSFDFYLMEDPAVSWRINVDEIDDEKAHGKWTKGKPPGQDEDSGHFQAQAGVTIDPDDAAYSANV